MPNTIAYKTGPGTLAYTGGDAPILSGRNFTLVADGTTYELHVDRIVGAGSQGVVVEATDARGRVFAAKIAYQPATVRDRLDRAAILDYLESLMRDHPLHDQHFKKTHLMPIYARGQVRDEVRGLGETTYDVVIMPLCQASYGSRTDVTFDEIRTLVLPQAAEALKLLHGARIVHRDIKPKNLYLLDGHLVVGDYGIAATIDRGRDARNTVTDRRTPGYSPHSSTIQCENDWYALGYTVWTLYNGGRHPHQALIDQDDLSEVHAGKRPCAFRARTLAHESLGQLVFGLTTPHAQGRLGYADIQRWVADPSTFTYRDPLARTPVAPEAEKPGYQFEGSTYRDRDELARALCAQWERGKRHLYTHALEEFFRRTGATDLAVALNDIVETNAATVRNHDLGLAQACALIADAMTTFCWHGASFALAGFAAYAGGATDEDALAFLSSGIVSWHVRHIAAASPQLVGQVEKVERDARVYPEFALAYARQTFCSPGAKPSWHGCATPDDCFAHLARTPLSWYRYMAALDDASTAGDAGASGRSRGGGKAGARTGGKAGTCASGDSKRSADIHDLLGTLAALGHYDAAFTLEQWLAKNPAASPVERGGRFALLFEAICSRPDAVRAFDRTWGTYGHVAWVQNNTRVYRALDDRGTALLARLSRTEARPTARDTVAAARAKLERSAASVDELSTHMPASHTLVRAGIFAENHHVRANTSKSGYFTGSFYGTPVPAGYIDALIEASKGDDDAVRHAQATMANGRLGELNRTAAGTAREQKERLEALAKRQSADAAITGHSRGAYIALTVVHVVVLFLIMEEWYGLADTIAEANTAFAGLGLINLPAGFSDLFAWCALGVVAVGTLAIVARRIARLCSCGGATRRAQESRRLADALEHMAQTLDAGKTPSMSGTALANANVSAYLGTYEKASVQAVPGAPLWNALFWGSAATCATMLLIASITGAPFALADGADWDWVLELGGWAQLAYAVLGAAAFAIVAHVRPKQDAFTFALLAIAPFLPYIAASLALVALVVGIVLFVLYVIFS